MALPFVLATKDRPRPALTRMLTSGAGGCYLSVTSTRYRSVTFRSRSMAKENSKQELGALVAPAYVQRPRERIVASAQDLFHRHGIRGVGVDAIAEAAGTNKMTLYRHFGSKDDLILEYLNYKGKKSDEIWAEIEAESPNDPAGQLYGFIEKAAKFITEDERGCDLANAAVELTEQGHPGLRVIEEFKVRQRDRLAGLCQAAGAEPRDRARISSERAKRSLPLSASPRRIGRAALVRSERTLRRDRKSRRETAGCDRRCNARGAS